MRARVLLWLVLASVVGCGPVKSPYMNDVPTPEPIATASGSATVVFVRPSTHLPGAGVFILDADAHVLGVSTAQSYFSITSPPGKHTFHVISDPPNALEAELEAGHIYFVEVGAVSIGVNQLFAVAPRTKSWSELPGWLADASQITPNQPKLPQLESDLRQMMDLPGEIQKGLAALKAYPAEERTARTIRAEDGVEKWPP